ELLTARSPFNLPAEDSTSDQNVIIQRLQRTTEAIKSVTPALPSLTNPKVPGVLDRIVMKLLEKNPADRYATGGDLAQALDQALADADPSWDEPFDVPQPLSRSAPTRGGRPAPAMGAAAASQPDMLPALSPCRSPEQGGRVSPTGPRVFQGRRRWSPSSAWRRL